ncbi:transposase [Algisphaera agarilytica]|uniref:REP element-mobilizing transposase RayT n=1 Tax=Algisphaera agarilytica TaxID=1385975 RepID=A0A7X0H4H9_9BACT|nr:transposase [Algisphaera agarilytica]MBB6428923.1 REP element-mobilizing transposase RayT [Algisphaera agarilytica]
MAEFRVNLLATMITTTTYGVWLPGDVRGYVEDGKVLPGDPRKVEAARALMTAEAVVLTTTEQDAVFDGLCRGVVEFNYELLAVSVESWHVHVLVSHETDAVKTVVGRLKNRMRQAVDEVSPGRGRVWAKGYDKRYCFTDAQVRTRMAYIERHAGCRAVPRP